MNHLSLFSGCEAFVLGLRLAGLDIKTVGYCEYDKYCQEILRARIRDGYLDDAPIWPDVRTFPGHLYHGKVDILSGGFPCQPHSVAGKRAGADDERNLWPDTLRIIGEVGPSWVLLENVPGILTNGFGGTVVGQLSEIGYDAEWGIVSAADVGANHLRKRWWVLAYAKQPRLEEYRVFNPSLSQRPGEARTSNQWETHLADAQGGRQQEQREREPTEPARASVECGSPEMADSFSQRQETGRTEGSLGVSSRGTENHGSETESGCDRTCGDWWSVEPNVGRVANGCPIQLDIIRTITKGEL